MLFKGDKKCRLQFCTKFWYLEENNQIRMKAPELQEKTEAFIDIPSTET